MIISHRNKFIFFKTLKTAGTSLEIALSKFCGPKDIITPIDIADEKIRKKLNYRTAQNYKKNLNQLTFKQLKKLLLLKKGNFYLFYNHITGHQVKRLLDEKTWEQYTKFTIVRNPWDRIISSYYWYIYRKSSSISFHEFLLRFPNEVLKNWFIYTENDELLVNNFIRYENLQHDLAVLSEKIGLNENIYSTMEHINAKSNSRPATNKSNNYFMLNEFEKNLIKMLGYKEIDYFHYNVP